MKPLFLLTIIVTILASCEQAPEDIFVRHFVIPKGEHYATTRTVEMLQSNTLSFKATFDQTAVYYFTEKGFQDSKNKLLGFSDCNSLHHENSARFAWQWFNDRLEIYAYCYVNGLRTEAYIGTVDIGTENSYEITLSAEYYTFSLNGEQTVSIQRGNTCDKGVYYMLWPYFGGTLPAPHDVHIAISLLN